MKPSTRAPLAHKFHILRTIILSSVIAYFLLCILAGIVIADFSLKLPRLPLRHKQAIAATVLNDFHVELQDVTIIAADGTTLKGWFVHPRDYNGNAVILLHGITDNREGVADRKSTRLNSSHIPLSRMPSS